MKHFFIIFLLFVWGFACPAVAEHSPVVAKVQSFSQSLSEDFELAKSLSPDELSLMDHPENFTVFSPVLWDVRGGGPLTGTKGLGPWHENEFLKARWVSCYSGTEGTTDILSGVQVIPAEEWFLRVPTISAATEPFVKKEMIFKPVVYPLPAGQTKTTQYEGDVFFPIFLALTEPGMPVTLKKELTITGCRGQGKDVECVDAVVPLTLSLAEKDHLPTAICAGIMHQLQSAPIPPDGAATVTATVNEQGAVQLLFQFEKDVKGLSIQIDNDFSFIQQKLHLTGKKAYVVIVPERPVLPGETLYVKALSSVGWFDMPVLVQAGSFAVSRSEFSWATAFKAGLLLLLFSPFYMLFFGWRVHDEKTFKIELRDLRLGIIVTALFSAFVWQMGWMQPVSFVSEPITFAIGMITAAGLIISPVTRVAPAFILFWLTPKPFLDETIIQATGWYPTAVCLLWGVIMLFPFNLVHAFSASFFRFYQYLSTPLYQVRLMMRLPMILLLLWGLFVQVLPPLIGASDAPYSPAAVQQAVQSGKSVFVIVTDGMHTASAANQILSGQVYPVSAWRAQDKLQIMTVPLHSAQGQNLVHHLALPNQPFALLYGPLVPQGMIVEGYIPEGKWHGRMNQINPQ